MKESTISAVVQLMGFSVSVNEDYALDKQNTCRTEFRDLHGDRRKAKRI